jgi:two-component system chemotaxis response regulator CheB
VAENCAYSSPIHFDDAVFDIVAFAAPAGGLSGPSAILSGLATHFPAATVVVQYFDPRHRRLMADIPSRRAPLPVKQAEAGDRLTSATVYIAPFNRHLLVNSDGNLSLSGSELVHFVRLSTNLLFESVAAGYKDRAIAVVLTGAGSDSARSVQAIKKLPLEEIASALAYQPGIGNCPRRDPIHQQGVAGDQRRCYDLTVEPLRDTASDVIGITRPAPDITERQVTKD